MSKAADPLQETTAPTPEALRGLWRREEIFTPSGYRDASTQVFWLQTQRFYVDIRVQADRPNREGAAGFAAYSDEELIKLAAVQGFAGVLSASGDVCFWRRDMDYQPPGPIPDEARFEIDGDRMGEFGIHADYTEIWRRESGSLQPLAAFERIGEVPGLLVIGGGHFMEVQGRATPLEDGPDLAHLVRQYLEAGERQRALEALSMRIVFGRVGDGDRPFQVSLSTLPWLETKAFFAAGARFDPDDGVLEGAEGRWSLREASCAASGLLPMFATS